ncbi:hypothetical protein VPNG_04535 [Cytospora leucostoma]|uniref:Uncharacterized protein n=1 Tax=Cytospora leucostoma TaxID=1230097 RepID=A0A423XCF2_9PEZI|nr:hypothetical protein VPNG_04535 [Cytospora leucostoma]
MSYYCANYYSFINCQNIVTHFGDRCDLCLVLKSGASLSHGMLPTERESSRDSHAAAEAPSSRKHHHQHRDHHHHHDRGHDGSRRALRVDSRYEK